MGVLGGSFVPSTDSQDGDQVGVLLLEGSEAVEGTQAVVIAELIPRVQHLLGGQRRFQTFH